MEPASHLTTDEGELLDDYRPLNVLALVALGVGLLGLMALVWPLLYLLPLAAIALGVGAFVRGRGPAPLAGNWLAVIAVLLGGVVATAVPVQRMARAQLIAQRAEPFAQVFFETFRGGDPYPLFQLTFKPNQRSFTKPAKPFEDNPVLKERYENFVSRPPMPMLLRVLPTAEVKLLTSEVTLSDDTHDAIRRTYLVDPADKSRPPFELAVTFIREPNRRSGDEDWFVYDVQLL